MQMQLYFIQFHSSKTIYICKINNLKNIVRRYFYLLLLLTLQLFGQSSPFAFSLGRTSGMSSNLVYDIFQDSKGFMWFATGEGISRFDGLQVKLYQSDKYTYSGVSNINQDYLGRIWFQDFNGSIYYIENENIKAFTPYKANGFLKYAFIKNQIHISGKEGIKIYDLKSFNLVREIKVNLKNVIQTVASSNRLYLIGQSIQYLDEKGEKHVLIDEKELTKYISAPIPVATKDGITLFSKFTSTYYEIAGAEITRKELPFNTQFTQNANLIGDDYWICSTKGIYKLNRKTNEHKWYFPNSNISYIIKTKAGKHWVSTINDGVLYIADWTSDFIPTPSTPLRLASNKESIFYSTVREEIFKLKDNKNELVYKGSTEHAIAPLFYDNLNHYFLFASSKFIIKTPNRNYESILAIKHIAQLDKKYYIVSASTWNGVIYINDKLKSDWDKEFESLPRTKVGGITFITLVDLENGKDCYFSEENKTIYFSTNYGIRKFSDGKVEEIKAPKQITFQQIGYLNNKIYLLSEEENLYTINNGNLEMLKFPSYFPNSKINRLRIRENKIYLFKDQVVYNYNPDQKTIYKTIDVPKGMEFTDLLSMNNQLYFASNKGIIRVSNLQTSLLSPVRLFINQILVNGKSVKNFEKSTLNPEQNNIVINYDILSESPNNSYSIFYRIDQNSWEQVSSSSRTLRFSSLAFGEHQIELKIVNGSQSTIKDFQFKINAPFWQKGWFITLIVLSVLLLSFLFLRYSIKKNNARNREKLDQLRLEKALNQSKIKSLKSQMNPHFFFNALNTLQSYILANDKKEAVSYLSNFSKLTRNILEMSDKDFISLREEISTLTHYLQLEEKRFNGDFTYHVEVDENLCINDLEIPTLLLQPYVENAIKHGLLHKTGDKTIILRFLDGDNYIKILIEDNGIGRTKSAELNSIKNKEHKSFATQSLNERIELLNKNSQLKIKLNYLDKPNHQGTIVELQLPKHD